MKKKFITVSLFAAFVLGIFAGCSPQKSTDGSDGADNASFEKVVDVYNWGEYIDESLLDAFEQETGITVNYYTFSTNEEMYAKLKSGGATYDVIIPSDYMISRMIQEDMLEQIDYENIPNFTNIDDLYVNPDYDPENLYSVPYMWGTVGIVYNTTMVTGPVDSWSVLFDEQYAGQILMFDNSRDAFGIALKYLGYSANTTDEAQLREACDLLIQAKPLFQAWVMDQIFDKMAGNEAALGPYYAGDAITMIDENPDLAFVVPKEGSNIFVDAMCIPKGAQHKENAEAFINYLCGDDAAVANAEYIGYSTPSKTAYALLPDEIKNDEIIYPPQNVLEKCESYINLPDETLALYDSLWVGLKSK